MKLKSAFLEISYAFFFKIFSLHMHFVNINVLDLSRSLHCTAALGICSNSWLAIRLCYILISIFVCLQCGCLLHIWACLSVCQCSVWNSHHSHHEIKRQVILYSCIEVVSSPWSLRGSCHSSFSSELQHERWLFEQSGYVPNSLWCVYSAAFSSFIFKCHRNGTLRISPANYWPTA